MNRLCKDNVMCCDENCKSCANLVYNEYLRLKKEKQEECDHVWELVETYHDDFYSVNKYKCINCGIEEEMSMGI